jgi:hypothetical protein
VLLSHSYATSCLWTLPDTTLLRYVCVIHVGWCFTASTPTASQELPHQASTTTNTIRTRVICTGATFSKQSCMFHNVCLQPSTDRLQLTAWLLGAGSSRHSTQGNVALLQQHLQRVLQGEYSTIDSRSAAAALTIDLPAASLHSNSPAGRSGNRGSASILATTSRTRSVTLASNLASADSSDNTATEQGAPAGAFNVSAFETEPAVAVLWRTVKENQYSFGHGEPAVCTAQYATVLTSSRQVSSSSFEQR